jgi:predicted amidophosphoribosyltransferase
MIIALAFRIDTRNADIFRRWLMERATHPTSPSVSVVVPVRECRLPN